ncbi:MAG: ABC transporter ATP-binding protein, partial [Chloroflexi bacterium]|nr:ABC transporter ATP-binding protein [Chloroflexota bacterium]
MKTLLRLVPFYRKYTGLFVLGYLAVIGNAGFNLLVPTLVGRAVDQGVGKQDINALIVLSILIMVFSAARGVCAFLQGYLGENAAQGGSYQLRNALYAHIHKLAFSFHDQAQTGELLARATSDVEQLRNFTGRGLLMIFNLILLIVGVTIALISMNWILALMALLMLPALYWRAAKYSTTVRPMFRRVQDQIARVAVIVQDNAAGARVVKAFGHQKQEIERFDKANDLLYDDYLESTRQAAFNTPLLDFMANGSMILMLTLAGYLLILHQLTLGELVAFYTYLLQVVAPIRRGGFLMSMASRAMASSERVLEILDAQVVVGDKPDAIDLPAITGRVEFVDVSCAYHPGRPVLEH